MINNYDRLKTQLNTLLLDPSVASQLPPALKARAQHILQSTLSSSEDPLFPHTNYLPPPHISPSQQQSLQKRRNPSLKLHAGIHERPQAKALIKYERVNGSHIYMGVNSKASCSQLKNWDGNSKQKLTRVNDKNKQFDKKTVVKCNTDVSLGKERRNSEVIIHKKVSISSLINNKQNTPSKQAFFSHNESHSRRPKPHLTHKSPFKNIKITRQSVLSNYQRSNQICQTQPSRTASSVQKNEGHREWMKKGVVFEIAGTQEVNGEWMCKRWSLQQSMGGLERLRQKQQGLNIQKESLQEKIKYYRWLIDSENNKNTTLKINIQQLTVLIGQRAGEEKASRQEIKISTKKSEGEMIELKRIQANLEAVSRNISLVQDSIEQQKYLISMYERVIEEIRHQLKIEQHEKAGLIRNLLGLKNQQKMMLQRYVYKQAFNDQIFTTLHQSLQQLA